MLLFNLLKYFLKFKFPKQTTKRIHIYPIRKNNLYLLRSINMINFRSHKWSCSFIRKSRLEILVFKARVLFFLLFLIFRGKIWNSKIWNTKSNIFKILTLLAFLYFFFPFHYWLFFRFWQFHIIKIDKYVFWF